MWPNCDCASFSWNLYSFEQNKNDINYKGNYYISNIGKLIKWKETEKNFASSTIPKGMFSPKP